MKTQKFTLIELLVVISILGVLAALVVPGYNNTAEDALDKGAAVEMTTIQDAFARFAADMAPQLRANADGTNLKLEDIAYYGLWPLMTGQHPDAARAARETFQYKNYDPASSFGRRGPYLETEAYVEIAPIPENADAAASGQSPVPAGASQKVSIPAVKDPYGGHYRILWPDNPASGDAARPDARTLTPFQRLQKMVIVCTGPDMALDTRPGDLWKNSDAGYNPALANDIKAQNDDTVMRLWPLAAY